MTDRITMPLYGAHTIAEMIEAIEAVGRVKVTSITFVNDVVTLVCEPIEDEVSHVEGDDTAEFEECYDCGGTCNYHMDWCPHNYA